MAGYAKPWTCYADQLSILQQRGMQVSNPAKALEYLERIGYYRLSGYWYDMRQWHRNAAGRRVVTDQFKHCTGFQNVVALYVFDKRLRFLVLDALERIEIALRVDLSYRLGRKGAFAYQDAAHFNTTFTQKKKKSGRTAHEEWLSKHDGLIQREIYPTQPSEIRHPPGHLGGLRGMGLWVFVRPFFRLARAGAKRHCQVLRPAR